MQSQYWNMMERVTVDQIKAAQEAVSSKIEQTEPNEAVRNEEIEEIKTLTQKLIKGADENGTVGVQMVFMLVVERFKEELLPGTELRGQPGKRVAVATSNQRRVAMMLAENLGVPPEQILNAAADQRDAERGR